MPVSDTIAAGSPVGRYEILSLLSAGGMGELYHARDPELGRELVVKQPRAASALKHPNIVTV